MKATMTIYDSNVWIAFFNEKDNQHQKAVQLLMSPSGPVKTALPEYVATEVCSILLFRGGRTIAEKFINQAFNNKDIEVIYSTRNFFLDTLSLFRSFKSDKLSFIDVSLLYLSLFHEVVTFDVELMKAARTFSR